MISKERIDFEQHLKDFIAYRKTELEQLATLRPNQFIEIEVKCDDLGEEYGNKIIEKISQSGIGKDTSVLYFITMTGDRDMLFKKVTKLKSAKRNKIALPQVNDLHFQTDSDVLYIGKTNSNFLSRMSYHLGLKSEKTYALHLAKWACGLGLDIKLYYATVDIEKENIKYLEMMESALHHSLKPLLGRSGH